MTVETASETAKRDPRNGVNRSNGTQAGRRLPDFDVVGLGLNATDTLLIVPHFPAYAGKVAFEDVNDEINQPKFRKAGAASQAAGEISGP
jgi:hypothetical protein